MNHPLLAEPEHAQRARELMELFQKCPDCLSPDEQALVRGILVTEQAANDVMRELREHVAGIITTMAQAHYTRDIRGELAYRNWLETAKQLREVK